VLATPWSVQQQEDDMEGSFFEGVALASSLVSAIAVVLLPAIIWDSETGRYRGYFNRKALGVLFAVAAFATIISFRQGNSSQVVFADVGFYLFIAIFISRVFVELSHHHKFGVWLHRCYHKMTEDAETPGK